MKKNKIISGILAIFMLVNMCTAVYSVQDLNQDGMVEYEEYMGKLTTDKAETQEKARELITKAEQEHQESLEAFDEDEFIQKQAQEFRESIETAQDSSELEMVNQAMAAASNPACAPTKPATNAFQDVGLTNPNYIKNENEAVSLFSGGLTFTYNILSLTGRNGLDFDLSIRYDSGSASTSDNAGKTVYNREFAQGWTFDLPHISESFQYNGSEREETFYQVLNLSNGQSYILGRNIDPITNEVPLLGDDYTEAKVKDVTVKKIDNQYEVTYLDGRREYYKTFYNRLAMPIPNPEEGQLVKIIDRFNNEINFTYEAFGSNAKQYLTKITDSAGRIITIDYETAGAITISVKENTSSTESVTYAVLNRSNGNLTSITDIENETTSFTYQTDYTSVWDADRKEMMNNNRTTWTLLERVDYPTNRSTTFGYAKYLRKYSYYHVAYYDGEPYNCGHYTITETLKINSISYYYKNPAGNDVLKEKTNYVFKSNLPIDQLLTDVFKYAGSSSYVNYDEFAINNGNQNMETVAHKNNTSNHKTITTYNFSGYGRLENESVTDDTYQPLVTTTTEYSYNANNQVRKKQARISNANESKLLYSEEWEYIAGKSPITKYTDKFGHTIEYSYGANPSNDSPYYIPLTVTKKFYEGSELKSTQLTTNTLVTSTNNFNLSNTNNYKKSIDTTVEQYDTDNDGVYDKTLKVKNYYEFGYIVPSKMQIFEDNQLTYTEDYQYDNNTYINTTCINRHYNTNNEDFNNNLRETQQRFTYYPINGRLKTATNQYAYYYDSPPAVETTSYEYDGYGRLRKTTYPDGTFVSNTYTYSITKNLNKVVMSQNNQYKTYAYYDGYGRPFYEGEINASGQEQDLITTEYTGNHLYKTVNSKGLQTVYTYDDFNNVTGIAYSGDGISIVDTYGYDYYNKTVTSDVRGKETTQSFDQYDRLISEQTHDRINTIEYDYMGNVKSQTDGNGNTTTFTYNQLGHLLSMENALGEVTDYTYDIYGNALEVTTPGGSTQSNTYDIFGKVLTSTDALGKTQYYSYDNDGYIQKTKDRNGVIATTEYKPHTKYPQTVTVGGDVTSYTYDNLGNVKTLTNREGVIQYDYTFNNLVSKITAPDNKTLEYQYDSEGNVISVKDYDSKTVEYEYNAMNQLTGTDYRTYQYNQDGRLAVIQNGNYMEGYLYNDYMEVREKSVLYQNQLVEKFSHWYDKNGNITTMSRLADGVEDTTTYTYDALNRLKSETATGGDTTNYTFDANGNIALKEMSHAAPYEFKQDGNDYSVTALNHSVTYAYDGNNRLLQEAEYVMGESENYKGTIEIFKDYTYDANGNMVKKETTGQVDEEVVEYGYTALNQLKELKKDGVTTATYGYDGTGMRAWKNVGGKETKFYWDRGNIINEGDAEGIRVKNYFGQEGIIGREENGSVDLMIQNARGDVAGVMDNGTITKNYDYTAYGVEKEKDEEDTNPFRYCGEYYDEESGLIYLRARYYDPGMGRFISEDTHWNTQNMIYGDEAGENPVPSLSAMQQSTNLYAYCMNNPIVYSDGNGEFAISATIVVTSATVALVKSILCTAVAVGTVIAASELAKKIDANKKNHIVHGSQNKHDDGWRKFNIDPNGSGAFEKILPLIHEAVDKGTRTDWTPAFNNGFIQTITYKFNDVGQTVIVKLFKDFGGNISISDAYVKYGGF